ncbi:Got1/Sft2-like family-domain-containing protein [Cladochytrium replicatum]|nr:Got1/Sft2-like family-domain-containing protein [Cladochytrium replicatum]
MKSLCAHVHTTPSMSEQRTFSASLQAFNTRSGSANGQRSSRPGSVGSMFQNLRNPFSSSQGGSSPGGGGSEDRQSLLSSWRDSAQNALAAVGLADSSPQQEDEFCGLTFWQRLLGFATCLFMAFICFLFAFFSLPLVVLRPAKFATLYTVGSILALSSMALLKGPRAHFKHITSRERLPFSIAYFSSMILTLYFALVQSSYIFTILFSIIQLLALLWYLGSYAPGGTSIMSSFTRWLTGTGSIRLPV